LQKYGIKPVFPYHHYSANVRLSTLKKDTMDEEQIKAIAAQLRKPEGEFGKQLGVRMNDSNQYINRNTITTVDPAPGDNILEIGMGNGFFVNEILSADQSIRYTGCDFSEIMVEEASRLNEASVKTGRA